MLVLSRKPGERIQVGPSITITVVEIEGGKIRFGIEAPEEVRVCRAESNTIPGQSEAESTVQHANQ